MKKLIEHHWKENIKPLLMFVIVGMAIMLGMRVIDYTIPSKPVEHHICIQDAAGDYVCETMTQAAQEETDVETK